MREFVAWALSNFVVGVWSSARQHNLQGLVQHIFGPRAQSLAFVWGQERCTYCGTIGGRHGKPVYIKVTDFPVRLSPLPRVAQRMSVSKAHELSCQFLQELQRLWEQHAFAPFGPSNTLLIDDDEYKARGRPLQPPR